MAITRSKSDLIKGINGDQNSAESTAESRGESVDNELFVPLVSPLPSAVSTVDEAHQPSTPDAAPSEPTKTIVVQRRKRKIPAQKLEPEARPAKKKKVSSVKPRPVFGDPDFIESKPDAATIMNFPLPKINHCGTRPLRVPRHLYPPLLITHEMMEDANAIEKLLLDLLIVREALDWDCRRLGRRLQLLRRKAALEEQREDARYPKFWAQGDESLLEFIKRLEEESKRLGD